MTGVIDWKRDHGRVDRVGVVGMDHRKAVVGLAVVAVGLVHELDCGFVANPSSKEKSSWISD